MTSLLDGLDNLPWPVLCVAMMVLAYLESAALIGLIVPGETGVVVGSVMASSADAPLPVFVVAVAVAAVAGDVAAYVLGRRYGDRVRNSRIGHRIGEERWHRSDQLLDQFGGQAVVIGRFVPVAQALVPMLAGAGGMPRRRFVLASAGGVVLWSALYVNAGFLLGESAEHMEAPLLLLGLGVVVVLVAISTVMALVTRRGTAVAASDEWPASSVSTEQERAEQIAA